jgi:hypothetical protein
MEDTKKVAPSKKPAAKKAVKKTTTVVAKGNLARGFFMTGLLGVLFFGLITFDILNPAPGIPEQLLENNIELLQTSAGLLLIGLFSFTKK